MKRFMPFFLVVLLLLTILSVQPAASAVDRGDEIRRVVTDFVTARTAGMGWVVRIRRLTGTDALKLPEGKIDFEVVAPQQWEGWGNVGVSVVARQNGRVIMNIPVRVDVEALTDMVVTLHQVEHGEILSDTDIALKKLVISNSSNLAARSINDVVGKKARSTLRANQPVLANQIERVPLVKSGQMVTIIAENEVMKISVSGKARSAGAEGDTIRVQNLTSLKEISARVISATTVQVAF